MAEPGHLFGRTRSPLEMDAVPGFREWQPNPRHFIEILGWLIGILIVVGLLWLVNRDLYVMVYEIIPKNTWVVFHPLYKTTNRGEMNNARAPSFRGFAFGYPSF